jgi:uncharacterized protein (TIGR03546 family)
MFFIQLFTKFLKILRAGQTPAQIAGGIALGFIAGLSPHFTLQILVLWLLILVLDVNLGAAFLGFAVSGLIAFLADPLFHRVGFFLLVNVNALRGLWTDLYNAPIAPLTKFNNTVVLGSFLVALVLSPFVYFGMRSFVIAYRAHIFQRIEKMKIYQIVRQNAVVRWYLKLRDLGG